MNKDECSIEEYDIFDFIVKYSGIVGTSVLHPDGLDRLVQLCHISSDKSVLDIAYGKDTSTVYFARKY